jgi:pimeloyl-ACP methyl ester carboxylesterase
VYLFDRRPDVWDSITVRDMAKDIASAMDTLHISNADVLGVSQGGMIGQYLAIDRPDLVHALVLAATLCRNNDTVVSVIDNWITLTQEHNMKALVHDMTVKLYSENYIRRYKPFLPLLTLLQKPKDPARFITLAKSCLTCDTYELLSQIQCPVLVIGGAQDKIVDSASAKELADKLGCELILYQHFGHAVYEEAKDFNQKVYDFFKQHV